MTLTVLLGGARSGKSAMAQQLASNSDAAVTLIATAEARDDEMEDRIARHRAARPVDWTTVEEPLELMAACADAPPHACLVVDCLTLWVSNAMGARWSDERIVGEARRAAELLRERPGPTLVVSNEVGLGVVPANELGRRFRDVLGRTNATFCAAADRAVFLVAGRLLVLDPPDGFEEAFRRG